MDRIIELGDDLGRLLKTGVFLVLNSWEETEDGLLVSAKVAGGAWITFRLPMGSFAARQLLHTPGVEYAWRREGDITRLGILEEDIAFFSR